MGFISAYLWELRGGHKKIQIEPLTYDEQKEIIYAYNQVVKLSRTADTSGIEIIDMQRRELTRRTTNAYFVSLLSMLQITRNQNYSKMLLFAFSYASGASFV